MRDSLKERSEDVKATLQSNRGAAGLASCPQSDIVIDHLKACSQMNLCHKGNVNFKTFVALSYCFFGFLLVCLFSPI
jgi:hypothetical protein